MDIQTVLVVGGGVATLVVGGYGWWNWNRQFRAPLKRAQVQAKFEAEAAKQMAELEALLKPKRKYTRKPKTNSVQLLAQSRQDGLLHPSFPPAGQDAGRGVVQGAGRLNGLDQHPLSETDKTDGIYRDGNYGEGPQS